MAEFLHTTEVEDEALVAGATTTYDLPVNPLSHLLMTIKFLSAGVDTVATLDDILAIFDRIEVMFKGTGLQSYSLADLYALKTYLLKNDLWQENVGNLDNSVRAMTFPILMGRSAFHGEECFPATRRGEFTLRLTAAPIFANMDTVELQLEAVQLPGATPSTVMKATTITKTPTAIGEHDVDLPIGNIIKGILLYATSKPIEDADVCSIRWLQLKVDGVERYFSKTHWQSIHNGHSIHMSPMHAWTPKIHMENLAAAYAQFADTDVEEQGMSSLGHYIFLDLDIWNDGSFALDTRGHARINLHIESEIADEIRVIPVEIIPVPKPT